MNCHESQTLLFTERDRSLEPNERASLDSHLANCAECKRIRVGLESAFSLWRKQQAAVTIPNSEREWHAVRRRIRGGSAEESTSTRRRRPTTWFPWLAFPLSAAAAVMIALYVDPFGLDNPEPVQPRTQAVRVDGTGPTGEASTMVFVDDKSGWLVVWANDSGPRRL
jgi:predicted anti-sigma-YlaC factor YlaD